MPPNTRAALPTHLLRVSWMAAGVLGADVARGFLRLGTDLLLQSFRMAAAPRSTTDSVQGARCMCCSYSKHV